MTFNNQHSSIKLRCAKSYLDFPGSIGKLLSFPANVINNSMKVFA